MWSSFLPRRHAGLSSLVGIQIFWILFWVSSLGIPWRLAKERKENEKKKPGAVSEDTEKY